VRSGSERLGRLSILVSSVHGGSRVELTGELDLENAEDLASYLRRLGNTGEVVSLDLVGLRFMDLAGLRVLLEARFAARLGGWELRVQEPSRAVARLCELTDTEHLLGREQ
jgi:anti-sigma B factor antagonist